MLLHLVQTLDKAVERSLPRETRTCRLNFSCQELPASVASSPQNACAPKCGLEAIGKDMHIETRTLKAFLTSEGQKSAHLYSSTSSSAGNALQRGSQKRERAVARRGPLPLPKDTRWNPRFRTSCCQILGQVRQRSDRLFCQSASWAFSRKSVEQLRCAIGSCTSSTPTSALSGRKGCCRSVFLTKRRLHSTR